MRVARRLTGALVAIMAAQAASGLMFPSAYRDREWVRATWFGNDWVTLLVAVPLLLAAVVRAPSSVRMTLVWLGVAGYATYNYAFYMFGAALNGFFLLYVVAFVLGVNVLILALSHTDAANVARHLRPAAPVRLVGGALVCIALGLAGVWITMWAGYVFAARATPVEPEVFKLVAALDLSIMVPALATGGVLLWKRAAWGLIVSAIAAVQSSLYLLVLLVNSGVMINRGLAAAPGELPIWGTLTVVMAVVTGVLFAQVRDRESS